MRTPRTHVPVAAILAITAGIATGQTTIQVPADQPTIAAGLAAAASGDTVLVAPGTYLEANLSFGGKDLSLVSEAGPGQTVIDAQAAGRVLLFQGFESQAALLEGFTLQNGRAPDGVPGGLQQLGWPGEHGGGLYVYGASPTVRDCVLRWNVAGAGGAGGGGLDGADGSFGHADAEDGETGFAGGFGGKGGAVYVYAGAPVFEGCRFLSNAGGRGGAGGPGGDGGDGETAWPYSGDGGDGGLGGWGARGGDGGAIATDSAFALVRSCFFQDNHAGQPGAGGPGGAGGDGDPDGQSGPTGHQDVAGSGGALHLFASGDEVNGCTVLDGSAFQGGGLYGVGGSVYNSILRGSTPSQLGGSPVVSHANVEGGYPGTAVQSGDPLFRDPALGDYRLSAGSPCLEAGDQTLGSPWTFDVAGLARVVASEHDLGAHEYAVPYLGTLEDLVLATQVAGAGVPTDGTKSILAGDTVTVAMDSPGATFTWSKPLFAFQGYGTGGVLPGPPNLPGVWVNGSLPGLTLLDLGGSPMGPILLPPGGLTLGFVVPPGLAGTTVRVQGIVVSGAAANGIYATTDAHELVLL